MARQKAVTAPDVDTSAEAPVVEAVVAVEAGPSEPEVSVEVPAAQPVLVRVVNIAVAPEYTPFRNGVLVRLSPGASVDRALSDITDGTRALETAGRVRITPLS